jgi:hypothetical protein
VTGFYFPASREKEERKNMGGNDALYNLFKLYLIKKQVL